MIKCPACEKKDNPLIMRKDDVVHLKDRCFPSHVCQLPDGYEEIVCPHCGLVYGVRMISKFG